MSTTESTQDHTQIKQWIMDHDGKPAVVKNTADDGAGAGILRVKFTDDDDLKEVDWEEFFATFDKKRLSFLYQPEPASRFFKFVSR